MQNEKVKKIANAMKGQIDNAKRSALLSIAMLGIEPGARVRRFKFDGSPDGDFIVARVCTHHGLWIYGFKCRADGTVGGHQHPVGNAWEVEVIK